jgi:hypothetical protein
MLFDGDTPEWTLLLGKLSERGEVEFPKINGKEVQGRVKGDVLSLSVGDSNRWCKAIDRDAPGHSHPKQVQAVPFHLASKSLCATSSF